MRNLIVASESVSIVPAGGLLPVIAIDSPSRTSYLIDGSNGALRIVAMNANMSNPIELAETRNCMAVDLNYIPELESLCLLTDDGMVIICDVHGDRGVEMVGMIASGIAGGQWSPDHELCCIVTRDGKLLMLTQQWDVLYEVDMGQTVMSVSMSWRGDGLSIAVCVNGASIELWDRDARRIAVSNVSETPLDRLLGPIAFRASGDFITAPITHDGGSTGSSNRMAIFEGANALRHGEFPIDEDAPRSLQWNIDSTLLAVVTVSGVLRVYTRSNYHWYMKASFPISCTTSQWDPERPHRLVALTADHLHTIDFTWDVVVDPTHDCMTAVIDDSTILITPLSRCMIPPPMCKSKLECRSAIRQIAISPITGDIASLCSNGDVVVFSQLSQRFAISIATPFLRHIEWLDNDHLVVVATLPNSSHDQLHVISLSEQSSQASYQIPSRAIRIRTRLPIAAIALLLDDNSIVSFAAGSFTPLGHLPSSCSHFAVTPSDDIIGLDARSNLFVNSDLISPQISSFALARSASVLLYTSSGAQNCLHTFDLATSIVSPDERLIERGALLVAVDPISDAVVLQMPRGNLETIHPRTLLLKSIATALSLRQWRPTLLTMRRHRIDLNLLYDAHPDTFSANCLEFVKDISDASLLNEFINAIGDFNSRDTLYLGYRHPATAKEPLDRVDLSSLAIGGDIDKRDEEADVVWSGRAPTDDGKTNHICQMIGAAIDRLDEPGKMFQSKLCALLKQNPPQLETALTLISNITDMMARNAALRFAVFLADNVDSLFDAALGMYDFDLVEMVAKVTQRDPKEYLPRLAALRMLPTYLQRHQIDCQLQRLDRALTHLASGPFPPCLDFILQHPDDLFKVAFRLFPDYNAPLLSAYAAHIGGASAGAIFEAAGDLPRAFTAYQKATQWRPALQVARRLGYNLPVIAAELARTLMTATTCADAARDAARLYIDFVGDEQSALRVLVRAQLWNDSILLAGRLDCIDSIVRPAVENAQRVFMKDATDATKRLRYCEERLRALRVSDPSQIEDDDRLYDDVDERQTVSNMSEFTLTSQCSTTSSWASTPWSNISSVSLKKKEKRAKRTKPLTKIREGDPREASFLRKVVAKVWPASHQYPSVKSLLLALLQFGAYDGARAVQDQFRALIHAARLYEEGAFAGADQLARLEDDDEWHMDFLAPLPFLPKLEEAPLCPIGEDDEDDDDQDDNAIDLF